MQINGIITGLVLLRSCGMDRRPSRSGWNMSKFPAMFNKMLFMFVLIDSMFDFRTSL